MSTLTRGVRYVSLPEPREHTAYRAASEEIEALLCELPGFVALYRLGSVRHPGISDLDRIAVVRAADRVPSIWPRLSADARYIAMHGPFLVDADTFTAHRWFTHLAGLELVAGDGPAIEQPSDPDRCDLHLAAEGLALLAIKLVQHARTGRVKVRSTLCEFHAMRFSLRLAGLDAEAAPRAFAFVDAVRDTRQAWFAGPRPGSGATAARLMADAPAAVLDALLALDRRLIDAISLADGADVALRGSVSPVRLVACGEPQIHEALAATVRPAPGAALIGRVRRLGALRWRTSSVRLPMPPHVLALLTQTREGATELHRTRRRVISDYARFLGTRGQGYSQIGLGGPFA